MKSTVTDPIAIRYPGSEEMKESLPFISTKLRVPMPRKDYILRDRLTQKISELWHHKITLVKGVAGSGKTTLVSSFLQIASIDKVRSTCFRWITLDQENDNLFSFWSYMLEAVKDVIDHGRGSIESVFPMMMNKNEIEKVIIMLINRLQDAGDIVIILDDLHVLQDAAVNQTLEFFIKYSSENIHFVLLTREDPKFYISDLLMGGQLMEIQEEELKFTKDEALRFLRDTLKINKSHDRLEAMNQQAEGWIGGLQLLALASHQKLDTVHLKNQIDQINQAQQASLPVLQPLQSLNKHLVEYLSKEILDAVSDAEKEFLIQTSVLPYFNENIANDLLMITDAKDRIAQLLDKNLFIIQLDGGFEQKGAYRYHNLFGRFLQQQFSNLDLETQRDVHLLAAKIYESYGDLDGCLHHLFTIRAYEEALAIIERLGQNPRGWAYLSQIPIEYVLEHKDMLFQRLFYHFCNMEQQAYKEIVDQIAGKIEHDSVWKVFQFSIILMEGNYLAVDTVPLAEIEAMNVSDVTKSILYLHLAHFIALKGHYHDALQILNHRQVGNAELQNPYVQYFALTLQVQILEHIGELQQCLHLYEPLFALIEKHPFLQPLTANTYIGVAGIHLKQANFDLAKACLDLANQHLNREHLGLERGYLFNVMDLACLQGHQQEAYEVLQTLMAYDTTDMHDWYVVPFLKYSLYLNRADEDLIDRFLHMSESMQLHNQGRAEEQLVYAMALHAKGRIEESTEIVNSILEYTRKYKIRVLFIETILFKLVLLQEHKPKDLVLTREVLNLFREAIHYSSEDLIFAPYLYYFDRFTNVVEMVRREKSKDLNLHEKQFIGKLLELQYRVRKQIEIENHAGKEDHTGKEDLVRAESLLSERELEVLQVMATGATNKQIAETLCISIATVKTHIIHIYAKLEVSNRFEALEKARKLRFVKTS